MSETLDQLPRRIALGVVLPASIVFLALLPLWLFEARLPEPLASHWNIRGQPNGAMPLARLALIIALFTGSAAATMCAVAFRRRAGRGEASGLMAVAAFVGGMFVAMSWLTIRANLDVADWKSADSLGFGRLLLSMVLPIGLGAAAAFCSRPLESAVPPSSHDLPSAGLAPGARAMWVGTARTTWALPLAMVFLALSVIVQSLLPALVPFHVAVGLLLLLFTSIRVTVDRSGVRIAYGLLGWPVQKVRLADIQQASMLQVRPMEWGGWGYRGSLRLLRRAAIVLRGGEGMRLELAGDRTLVITVDGAEQGAGLVNDLLATMKREGASP